MRPGTILAFEWLFLASLASAVVRVGIAWSQSVMQGPIQLVLGVLFFSLVLNLTLVLFVSRRRSRIAKWILVALFLIGLTSYLRFLVTGVRSFDDWAEIGLGLVQALGIAMLFTTSAREWLAPPRAVPPSVAALGRTFK
jgi:hypothetical protein